MRPAWKGQETRPCSYSFRVPNLRISWRPSTLQSLPVSLHAVTTYPSRMYRSKRRNLKSAVRSRLSGDAQGSPSLQFVWILLFPSNGNHKYASTYPVQRRQMRKKQRHFEDEVPKDFPACQTRLSQEVCCGNAANHQVEEKMSPSSWYMKQ